MGLMGCGEFTGSLRRRIHRLGARFSQHRIRAADTGPGASAGSARVAVIVPVFNAMPYLQQLLDSLAGQDLDPAEFEVILIDDGSTDGGAPFMDRFAAAHPNTRVIRQRNSGWPGQPRNRGLDATRADYVFFADADDVLAPHALRSMLDYASEHGSDMVLPRIAGINGRAVNRSLFARSEPEAGLRQVFGTLAPQKLIRRGLVERLGLRFPEGRVRLEDGIFITACYLGAARISVLAEDSYYFLRAREDANNISARKTRPEGYTRSVRRIAQQVLEPELARLMVLDLYQRKILRTYRPGRWLAMPALRRCRWLRAHRGFVERYIPAGLEARLDFPHLQRSAALRTGDPARVLHNARLEAVLAQPWSVVPADGAAAGPQFAPAGPLPQKAELILRPRTPGPELVCALRPAAAGFGLLDATPLAALAPEIYDVSVRPGCGDVLGEPRRVRVATHGWEQSFAGRRFYATVNGYLSLDARGVD